ncbi:MAG: SpoVR family protein, partial [Deltaproteobacteria bacterium]|nr:SpoVR family protein [Deltaproteobacteria bacterium]
FYPHWRFGMEYERLQKSYSYGLHKIYEMVINTDPAYAYLLEDNAIVDQKLVMAHVFAHVDFFKNNAWFAPTNRKMADEMANHGARVRRYVEEFGLEQVEGFIDRCLSLENLIDFHAPYVVRRRPAAKEEDRPPEDRRPEQSRFRTKKYMEPYVNPAAVIEAEEKKARAAADEERRYPKAERDVLGFLAEHAPLDRWQRNVLSMVREEAYYFAPQRMTKILNEGWATYWHSRMMTEKLLAPDELIDYADHHSATVATAPGRLNPYALGLALLRDIRERWDQGRFGKEYEECTDMAERERWDRRLMLGNRKLFEVRAVYNDVMFLDEFLTPDFVARKKLFRFQEDEQGTVRIDSRRFKKVKDELLFQLTNLGEPVITIEDDNHANRKELLLRHRFEGIPLRHDWAVTTLGNVARIWTRPVHLETVADDKPVLLTHDGKDFSEKSGG